MRENKSKIYELYLNLIENPFAPKNYRELYKQYIDNNAKAFEYVISVKFHESINTSDNQKQ